MVKIDPRTRFALYAAALFVATHWPALVLPSVVPVSDKTIHFVAWGIWLALLSSAWKLPLGLLLVTGLACSVADDASQAIPVLNRHASLMDAVANVIGIVAVWSWVVSGRHRACGTKWSGPFFLSRASGWRGLISLRLSAWFPPCCWEAWYS